MYFNMFLIIHCEFSFCHTCISMLLLNLILDLDLDEIMYVDQPWWSITQLWSIGHGGRDITQSV